MRLSRGQEAFEFVLITILVFCGALLSVFVFSSKISAFFAGNSTVSQTALGPNTYVNSGIGKFQQDFQTEIEEPPLDPAIVAKYEKLQNSSNLATDDSIATIAGNINEIIQTSGASGATDDIVNSLNGLVNQLENLALQDPANSNLQQLASLANSLSEAGYLVSDTQEWIEKAVYRLSESNSVTMPSDNNVCQEGNLKWDPGLCDNTIGSNDFFYSRSDNLLRNLSKYTNQFDQLNASVQHYGENQPTEVTSILNTINILSRQIDNISNVMSSTVNNYQKDQNQHVTKSSLNSSVASQTTDYTADLIKEEASDLDEVADTSDTSKDNTDKDDGSNNSLRTQ